MIHEMNAKLKAPPDGRRAGLYAGVPTGVGSEAPPANLSEQSGELAENKEAVSENKPETKLSPVEQ
ncbi:MAG: hypothetical protein ACLQOO_07230 [Terriglobia bacterium]